MKEVMLGKAGSRDSGGILERLQKARGEVNRGETYKSI
jgi:hypothetical protein